MWKSMFRNRALEVCLKKTSQERAFSMWSRNVFDMLLVKKHILRNKHIFNKCVTRSENMLFNWSTEHEACDVAQECPTRVLKTQVEQTCAQDCASAFSARVFQNYLPERIFMFFLREMCSRNILTRWSPNSLERNVLEMSGRNMKKHVQEMCFTMLCSVTWICPLEPL